MSHTSKFYATLIHYISVPRHEQVPISLIKKRYEQQQTHKIQRSKLGKKHFAPNYRRCVRNYELRSHYYYHFCVRSISNPSISFFRIISRRNPGVKGSSGASRCPGVQAKSSPTMFNIKTESGLVFAHDTSPDTLAPR